jgi:diguanylate cyclase (GGDEF)-like protein
MSVDPDDPLKDTQTLPTPGDGTAGPTDSPYLIVLRGLRVGEMFRISSRITIGRDDSAEVRMSDAGVSRSHARILTRPDGVIYLVDLDSSNGTFVNGERITGPTFLADGDKIGVGFTSILKFTYSEQLEKLFPEGVFNRARKDDLTGALKRKYFDERLHSEFAYARRHQQPLALLFIDIDHFKTLNDLWGYPAGDAVLAALSRRVQGVLRSEDIFARYGGEEFALICRSTDEPRALALGERLRALVAAEPFFVPSRLERVPSVPVTISVGVAVYPDPGLGTPGQLLAAADRALFAAKSSGQNIVRLASSQPPG